ncbi:hypothetical protein MKX50_08880 [Paenibacillus sp. FSL W8-0186]|uniref:Uncharacterized protein n=1 Tax=Paenibacillus woosongensis TaxID=307580 RepID=A0ABQ4MLN8_9BACL|nr:hypothetical protein [Paenibacillus woosongensis]GIP56911.1 hypothetical protein J15TS10_07250 [Paenibacillus woosongensis]
MDMVQALDGWQECVPVKEYSRKEQCFLGYRAEDELPVKQRPCMMPACRRFANVYSYVRILWSMEEKRPNESDWPIQLRANLTNHLQERLLGFGRGLQRVEKR